LLAYLAKREGKGFVFPKLRVRLNDQSEVEAYVPLYEGRNLIEPKAVAELVPIILSARGTCGPCLAYVKGVAEKLSELGIKDQAVSDLWKAVANTGQPKNYGPPD
jgi:cation transport regulator ChaC